MHNKGKKIKQEVKKGIVNMRKKRETPQIKADILEWLIFNNGAKQTELMYKVNMSHGQTKGFLNELKENELINIQEQFIGSSRRVRLYITKKGIQYYLNYRLSKGLLSLNYGSRVIS